MRQSFLLALALVAACSKTPLVNAPPTCAGLGQAICNDACTDTFADSKNCGSCGNTCPVGTACSDGACVPWCAGAGGTLCAGDCVDIQTDNVNCGGCAGDGGQSCATGQ